jgi:hypothetical protein
MPPSLLHRIHAEAAPSVSKHDLSTLLYQGLAERGSGGAAQRDRESNQKE